MANEITVDEVKAHNEDILANLRKGCLVKIDRGLYTHWVVYIGNKKVIHWQDEDADGKMCIQTDEFWNVVKGGVAHIGNDPNLENSNIDDQQVVIVATSITSDGENCPFNCEHFAKFCRYGQGKTNPVQIMSGETSTAETSEKSVWSSFGNAILVTSTNEEIRKHNDYVLKNLAAGDLIKFHRSFYDHWAVYIGIDDSKVEKVESVIHMWGDGNKAMARIRIDPFWNVTQNNKVEKDNTLDDKYNHYDGNEVVKRAKSKYDAEQGNTREYYNLFVNNCEHFAKWCRYGKKESGQISTIQDVWEVTKEPLLDIRNGVACSVVGMFGGVEIKREEGEQNERINEPMKPHFTHIRSESDEDVVGTFGAGAVGENVKGEQEEETNHMQVPNIQ